MAPIKRGTLNITSSPTHQVWLTCTSAKTRANCPFKRWLRPKHIQLGLIIRNRPTAMSPATLRRWLDRLGPEQRISHRSSSRWLEMPKVKASSITRVWPSRASESHKYNKAETRTLCLKSSCYHPPVPREKKKCWQRASQLMTLSNIPSSKNLPTCYKHSHRISKWLTTCCLKWRMCMSMKTRQRLSTRSG